MPALAADTVPMAVTAVGLAGGGEARAVVQIGVVGRVGPARVLREDPGHLAALGVGVLDDDDAAGAQQPVRGALDAADGVEAVLAGEQREFAGRGRGPRAPRTPTR